MFHFFRSQGKAAKYLLSGLLFMVALSMLVYLVPNYYDSTDQTGTNAVLLQVGDRKLTSLEAQNQFSQAYQGRVPPEMQATFFPQWLDGEKRRLALVEAARRIGLTTSNEEIAEYLGKQAPFAAFFENGKLINREGFEAAVAQIPGYDVPKVFEEMRQTMTASKLADALTEVAVVSPKEIEDAYKRKYELASVDYVSFLQTDWLSKVKVTDEELKTRWEAAKASYTQPQKYSFRTVVLSQASIESRLAITEQDARQAYQANIDDFRTPEQIHARHILKMTDGKTDDEKKKAKQQLEDILKQIRAGADFVELAKKNSDDQPDSGGDLGTKGRGSFAKPFEDAAFALKPKEVSGVVESEFGYHIIKVEEKTPSTIRPFDSVRADIERELRNQKLANAMDTASAELHAAIKKDPANISAAAQKAGAEVITVTEVQTGTPIPSLGVSPEIDRVLPVLKAGGVSDVILLPGDRAVVVILDKIVPSRQSTFDEVRDSILSSMRDDAARKLVDERSKKAAERLRAGDDIKAVAKDLETTVHTASSFTASDSLPDIGPAVYFEDAFKKGVGTVIGPVLMQGSYVVAKVIAKTEADLGGLAAEKKTLTETLRRQRAEQNNTLFQESIVRKLTDDGAIKLNQSELSRIIAQMK